MKYYLFLTVLAGFLSVGCSVDNEEIIEDQIYDLSVAVDCGANYDLMDGETVLGRVVITNNKLANIVYLKFIANEGYAINAIRYGYADNVDGLPTNNGGIIPGKLTSKEFNSLDEVSMDLNIGHQFVYTARVELVSDSGTSYSVWLGDILLGSKESKYLTYTPCLNVEDIPCYVGSNKSVTLTNSYVKSQLYGVSLLERYYLSMLDAGVSTSGTFQPSIYSTIQNYKSNNFQTFTTTYTVTEEGCSESVSLSITVIE
ncbi:MAG: hypothetical protein R3250_13305 [Melioribacteraceae bacterium]|nr:hypothetical protein [Melioribacteraceae bacterium]